ncbi:uncharacterized protein N7483_006583 [Penicillium malachiteum]|uniref:uncharacterized protein n=1 Tax=Penicillium malachiteum TaxID=1324776 RepID=UPI002549608D|nr:uncharacterized protein N7483_006583 [Penicillium malachiteum]KAJ5725226.1 hypothetical protein N7483_006583 [Penicillium malachiteum]
MNTEDGESEENISDYNGADETEQEIEDHEYIIPGDVAQLVKIRLFLMNDKTGNYKWMKNFVAECTCNGVVVATTLARHSHPERTNIHPGWTNGLRRHRRYYDGFWETVQERSAEMCRLAFEIFDRYGTIMTKYKDHPRQRGTGIWGSELDQGPLFFFENLHITALKLRRKGLGQKVVSLLLEKAKKFSLANSVKPDVYILAGFDNWTPKDFMGPEWTLHALVIPGYLKADIASHLVGKSPEERLMIKYQTEAVATDFWRSCGFRRIGVSDCFAFSFIPDHPSHALAAASDFNPRRSKARDLENEELRVIYEIDCSTGTSTLRMERLRNALPLHHAALTLTDEELKAFFITHIDDKIGWDRVTNSEATLLHLTACEFKPLSAQWLLEKIHDAESWKTARDIDGHTPFEELQEKLKKMRTQSKCGLRRIKNVSDQFDGNPDAAVSCLCLLSGKNPSANKACFRYGCTYGESVEGFISVKMKNSMTGHEKNPKWTQRIEDGGWVRSHGFLDCDVHRSLAIHLSQRLGFVNMFQLVVNCLNAEKAPTVENLEWCCNTILNQRGSEWPLNTYMQSYLRRAGTQKGCRAVLRSIIESARLADANDEAGRGWEDTNEINEPFGIDIRYPDPPQPNQLVETTLSLKLLPEPVATNTGMLSFATTWAPVEPDGR